MKKLLVFAIVSVFTVSIFTSCRETEKTQEEQLIEEMKADGAEVKIKTDGDETKIKMETEDKSVKIKKESGETTKIKVDTED